MFPQAFILFSVSEISRQIELKRKGDRKRREKEDGNSKKALADESVLKKHKKENNDTFSDF